MKNLVIAIGLTAAFTGLGALLGGPSDHDVAVAQAADLAHAKRAAAVEAMRLKRCRDLCGPKAEVVLVGIDGRDYVCRVPEGAL
jgi:hypothetical protein